MTDLIETYRGGVYPWQCDHMGHMNVMWYVGKFDEATWQLFAGIGLTASYFRDNTRGMAAVEQRVIYKRELYAGDVIEVRSGILEMHAKAIRFVHEMKNTQSGELAAITVLTAVHIHGEQRRATPFPDAVLARGSERVIVYEVPA